MAHPDCTPNAHAGPVSDTSDTSDRKFPTEVQADYLEMLLVKFEVSTSLNSMAVREIIRLDYKQIRKIRKTRRLDH